MTGTGTYVDSIHVRRLQGRVTRTTTRLLDHARSEGLGIDALASVRLPWYHISEGQGGGAGTPHPPTVLIYDEIGGSFGVSAKQFAMELEAIDAPLIHVRINSPGGEVFEALAIYNSLHHHRARIVVFVDSLAASAASIIAMGGDEIVMMPGSQMMIHDASALEDGNAADHDHMALFLSRQSDNLADIYRLRAGGDVATWRALMLAETWLFADEAVTAGLADRVSLDCAPPDDPQQQRMLARTFSLGEFRYAGRAAAPPPRTVRAPRPAQTRPGAVVTARSAPRAPAGDDLAAIREAGARRAAKAAQDAQDGERGHATMDGAQVRLQAPGGAARRVCTQWLSRTDPLPRLLRASKVERGGKPFYLVEGYATVYERGYEMWDWAGPYTEVVAAGAGDATVAASPDVVFLVNHRGLAMARTASANTLELWSDATGMGDRAYLNPARSDVKDLVAGIDDGVITEQSFAFVIVAGQWSPDYTEYRISEFDVDRGDVCAVNYGANPYTSIAARGREILDALDDLPTGAARAALERLSHRGDLAQMPPPPTVDQTTVDRAAVPAATLSASRVAAFLAAAEAR